jgi:hypothetical protein
VSPNEARPAVTSMQAEPGVRRVSDWSLLLCRSIHSCSCAGAVRPAESVRDGLAALALRPEPALVRPDHVAAVGTVLQVGWSRMLRHSRDHNRRWGSSRKQTKIRVMSAFDPLRTLPDHAHLLPVTRQKRIAVCLAFAAASSVVFAQARPLNPAAAKEVLGLSDEDAQTTSAKWNGQPTVFVEYITDKARATVSDPVRWDEPPSQHVDMWTGERDKEFRRVVAVQQGSDGKFQSTIVTDVQSDARFASVAAIGFANADRDRDQELIVIVQWETQGGVGGGIDYQVRLFDQPDPSKPYLPALEDLSNHFGVQFDGHTFDTGERVHARFKTIRAVQRELRRLGY